jgi:hypothetical protein
LREAYTGLIFAVKTKNQSMNSKLIIQGLIAGAAGVAAMTLAEKLEQVITKRPNSYVPDHTLRRLLGTDSSADKVWTNLAMHWGQGIILGAVRTLMAEKGIRGPVSSFLFMNLRLLTDQTLENSTGVGAPPWTWPKDEQVIDLIHKGIYAFATGAVADSIVNRKNAKEIPRKGWKDGRLA